VCSTILCADRHTVCDNIAYGGWLGGGAAAALGVRIFNTVTEFGHIVAKIGDGMERLIPQSMKRNRAAHHIVTLIIINYISYRYTTCITIILPLVYLCPYNE